MNIQLIPIWVKALVLIGLLGVVFYKVYDLGYDARDLEIKTEQLQLLEDSRVREAALRAELAMTSMNLQEALQRVRVEVVYVDRVTRREIEKPIYSECLVPQSGVQLINENANRFNALRGD